MNVWAVKYDDYDSGVNVSDIYVTEQAASEMAALLNAASDSSERYYVEEWEVSEGATDAERERLQKLAEDAKRRRIDESRRPPRLSITRIGPIRDSDLAD